MLSRVCRGVSHVAVVVEVQRRTVRVKGAGGGGGEVALGDSLNVGRLWMTRR